MTLKHWMRSRMKALAIDEELILSLRVENSELTKKLERQQAENLELAEDVARLEERVRLLSDQLAEMGTRAESLRTAKGVWDAMSRLEGDIEMMARQIDSAKGAIGRAYDLGVAERG